MSDWKEALEQIVQTVADQQAMPDDSYKADAATIRAHIEGLEARVRELEAVAGYADHRVDCRHATYAAEACDCGLDAAMLPAVRDGGEG